MQHRGEVFPQNKKEDFIMLQALKEDTGLGANLQPQISEAYRSELKEIETSWDNSIQHLTSFEFIFHSELKDGNSPSHCCEPECPESLYNAEGVPLAEGYSGKDVVEIGAIPCTFKMILEYFGISKSLESICRVLVRNGYRTEDGMLTLAFDKILEKVYGIETEIESSVLQLCGSVSTGHPVIALVEQSWLYGNALPGNTCIIIWQLNGERLSVSTITSPELRILDMLDTFKHIQRAWACKRL